ATSTVTGQQLWKALENGVSKWPGDGRFPQISGFRFTFNPDLPVGARVLSVARPDGTPIAADTTSYTITTLDYVVYGGDGYGDLFNPTTAKIQGPFVDVFIDLLKSDMAAGRVTQVPAPDGRITRVGG
ncbi:MAG: 5'-nucleotidase C-terminal domain-containing protein, partial [Solirubrobacterales bacterium]